MSTLGNILWFVLGGVFIGLGYIIGGIFTCLTIIGIPFGIKAIQMGFAMMLPFGKDIEPKQGGTGCVPTVLNIFWLILFGWELALLHFFFGILLGLTIVGIPFARQHFKLVPLALLPFSYNFRQSDQRIRKRH